MNPLKKTLDWSTGSKPEGATHVVDDGGMIYWTIAGDASDAEVAGAFVTDYDGDPYPFEVLNLRTGDVQEIEE